MSAGLDDGDRDLDAAEYVLGTLDREERRAFASELASDPSARRAVAAWETRFAGLADRLEPLSPSADVWQRIERALFASAAPSAKFAVLEGGGRATDAVVLRQSRNRWRTAALLTGSIAAALVAFVADRAIRTAPTERDGATYVAAVNRGGDKPALIVRVDMKTGQVLVRPVAATAPEGRSLELWYIGTDKTPRSMGLVDASPANLALPAGANREGGTFAVSVEPQGGSKTGGPTGPVLYMGQLVKE